MSTFPHPPRRLFSPGTSACSPGSWDRWIDAEKLLITTNRDGLGRSLEDFLWVLGAQVVWGRREPVHNPQVPPPTQASITTRSLFARDTQTSMSSSPSAARPR